MFRVFQFLESRIESRIGELLYIFRIMIFSFSLHSVGISKVLVLWRVTHSEKGTETLEYFLLKVCGIPADWKLENMKEDEIEKFKRMVG